MPRSEGRTELGRAFHSQLKRSMELLCDGGSQACGCQCDSQSPSSKPAGCRNVAALAGWKPAIQQARRPALRPGLRNDKGYEISGLGALQGGEGVVSIHL